MNLKESFRYSNKLGELIGYLEAYLSTEENVTKRVQEHLKSRAYKEATDEVVDLSQEREINTPINDLLDFFMYLLEQKQVLNSAISTAKAKCEVDIDTAIGLNVVRQRASCVIRRMSEIKARETKFSCSDYKFNAEGNQVPYEYNVTEVSTIDFDRNKAKAIAKKLIKEADDVSAQIEKVQIETTVDYEPLFDVNDSFEDILLQFLDTKK